MQNSPYLINICMLGAGYVGKSALALQFMYEEFVEDYEPTKSNAFNKVLDVDGVSIQANIHDTAGQDDYAGLLDMSYRQNSCFFVVFSLTDSDSFSEVKSFLERIEQGREQEPTSIILLGNKSDLDGREVPFEEAQKLAASWKIPYIETSAKTDDQKATFSTLIRQHIRLIMSTQGPIEQVSASGNSCCCLP